MVIAMTTTKTGMICKPVDLVQVLVVEDVRPEDRHRQPDPEGRQELDQQEPPVAEDQPEAVEEEDEGADREGERAEEDVRLAHPHDRLLDLGFVGVLDGAHELADPSDECREGALCWFPFATTAMNL